MIQRRKDTDVERVTEKKEKVVKEQERRTEEERERELQWVRKIQMKREKESYSEWGKRQGKEIEREREREVGEIKSNIYSSSASLFFLFLSVYLFFGGGISFELSCQRSF